MFPLFPRHFRIIKFLDFYTSILLLILFYYIYCHYVLYDVAGKIISIYFLIRRKISKDSVTPFPTAFYIITYIYIYIYLYIYIYI